MNHATKPGQKFRPKVLVIEVERVEPCEACGRDVAPHNVSHWINWHYGPRQMREAVCKYRIHSVLLAAYAAQRTTGIPNLQPPPKQYTDR